MWVAYYLRRWTRLLAAAVRLLRLCFGRELGWILRGAWLMLRAVQSWAPFPDNDPDGAQARLHDLYALVRLRFGEPADPARAARLEIDWWRAHRKRQHAPDPGKTGDELLDSVTRLYCYLFGKTEAEDQAGLGAPGAGDGSVRPMGPGGLPAGQPAAPAGARRAGPRLRCASRRRLPVISLASHDDGMAASAVSVQVDEDHILQQDHHHPQRRGDGGGGEQGLALQMRGPARRPSVVHQEHERRRQPDVGGSQG